MSFSAMRTTVPVKKGDILTVNRFGRVYPSKPGSHSRKLWPRIVRWFWKERFLGVANADVEPGINPWGSTAVFHDGMRLNIPIIGEEFKAGDLLTISTFETTNPFFKVVEAGTDGFVRVGLQDTEVEK